MYTYIYIYAYICIHVYFLFAWSFIRQIPYLLIQSNSLGLFTSYTTTPTAHHLFIISFTNNVERVGMLWMKRWKAYQKTLPWWRTVQARTLTIMYCRPMFHFPACCFLSFYFCFVNMISIFYSHNFPNLLKLKIE